MEKPKESSLYASILIKATELGARVFRNNVGQLRDINGRYVRYGICNPGGSDFIGLIPCVVTQEMVGSTIAIFVSVEVKPDRGAKLSRHQRAFLEFVSNMGGIAIKTTSATEFEAQIKKVLDDVAAGKKPII